MKYGGAVIGGKGADWWGCEGDIVLEYTWKITFLEY